MIVKVWAKYHIVILMLGILFGLFVIPTGDQDMIKGWIITVIMWSVIVIYDLYVANKFIPRELNDKEKNSLK